MVAALTTFITDLLALVAVGLAGTYLLYSSLPSLRMMVRFAHAYYATPAVFDIAMLAAMLIYISYAKQRHK